MGCGPRDERREHAHHEPDEEAAQGHGEEGDDAEGNVNAGYLEPVVLHLGQDVHHVVQNEGDAV